MLLNDDFKDFLSTLNKHKVSYLLVGGYAYILHLQFRNTDDIDIWIDATAENAGRLVAAMKEFGAPAPKNPDDFSKPDYMIGFGVKPWRIEILTSISGISFNTAWPNHSMEEIAPDLSVPVISLKDMITNKRASGRPKDLIDLEYLEKALKDENK